MRKLDTTEAILEWVAETTVGRLAFEPEERAAQRIEQYTETAAYLAECVRLRQIVEAHRDSDRKQRSYNAAQFLYEMTLKGDKKVKPRPVGEPLTAEEQAWCEAVVEQLTEEKP